MLVRRTASDGLNSMADVSPSPEPSRILALIQGTTAVPRSIAKLIDTVGEQIGLFLEPYHIRRKGQAEADVTVAETQAKAQIAVVRLENKLAIQDLEDRTEERVRRREAKRQKNLEAITVQAAREIPGSVSDQPVDEDWVAQFFDHCQDVSNEQMQVLWSRLLAGEVAKPGSFSLRTLTFTRTLSKHDAGLFTRFCSLLWMVGAELSPLTLGLDKLQSIPGMHLQFHDFIRLDSVGLIRFEALGDFGVTFTVNKPSEDSRLPSHLQIPLLYHGRRHVLSKPSVAQSDRTIIVQIGKALLTDVGQELAPISGSRPNEAYRQLVVSELCQGGWEVAEL